MVIEILKYLSTYIVGRQQDLTVHTRHTASKRIMFGVWALLYRIYIPQYPSQIIHVAF